MKEKKYTHLRFIELTNHFDWFRKIRIIPKIANKFNDKRRWCGLELFVGFERRGNNLQFFIVIIEILYSFKPVFFQVYSSSTQLHTSKYKAPAKPVSPYQVSVTGNCILMNKISNFDETTSEINLRKWSCLFHASVIVHFLYNPFLHSLLSKNRRK